MKYWIVIFACATLHLAYAQDSILVFDRPGVADSPYLTMPKKWYIEAGYGLTNSTKWSDLLAPSCMLRKSIYRKAETRIAINTTPQSNHFISKTKDFQGNFVSIGFKQKLFKEQKLRPETAIIVNTYSGLSFYRTNKFIGAFAYEAQLRFQNNVNDFLSINYNLGYIRYSSQKSDYFDLATCLNFTITNNLGAFVENFNYWNLNTNFFEASYDFGLIYSFMNQYQIDVSYIANHSQKYDHYGTLQVGFSFKL